MSLGWSLVSKGLMPIVSNQPSETEEHRKERSTIDWEASEQSGGPDRKSLLSISKKIKEPYLSTSVKDGYPMNESIHIIDDSGSRISIQSRGSRHATFAAGSVYY